LGKVNQVFEPNLV